MSAPEPDPNQPSTSKGSSRKLTPIKEDKEGDQKRESLKEVMARRKKELGDTPSPQPVLVDPYANSTASNYISRGRTAFCFDKEHNKHYCEWDPDYPECPERADAIMQKIHESGLLEQCFNVPNYLRPDLYERITRVHTPQHYEKLKNVCTMGNLISMEREASRHDSVYFGPQTFNVACRAVSAAVNVTLGVGKRDFQNGLAVVRPPGHHAMKEDFNGYCYFNNVAVAAEACLHDKLSSRVLIVDIDVHHGQGTQQIFYERKDVLYFSIHRYEHGHFWPNLAESNFNYIGKGEGLGYNINVPLNAAGLCDEDYLAVIFSLLLPVAYEYNPDLIIVSAGYDAALGCPEGRMNVTPGFFPHMITLLSAVARGQMAVILEGGYFLPSLAEGTMLTLKALLGGPCPFLEPLRRVNHTVCETICNVRRMLMNHWNCFKHCEIAPPSELHTGRCKHHFVMDYLGMPEQPPFLTRKCYPELTMIEGGYFDRMNSALQMKYRASVRLPVVYAYDESMLAHTPVEGQPERPERPERLTSIIKLFTEFGVDSRLVAVPVVHHDITPYNPHSRDYLNNFHNFVSDANDIYVNEYTYNSAMVAVSALMSVIDVVMEGGARSGIAVVRPPGHHAEHDKAMGFCFINNIAVAARYLRDKFNITRVLIIDFDIHHGNGTQNIFYTTNEVMYISIHRDEEGRFFPKGSRRSHVYDGHGLGQGYNVNIPFSRDKMGDTEYIAAFHNIILPMAYTYAPKMILVSAGFDAGINDPLGGYQVNPETFGHFIHMLKPLAEGRLILSLEGGYNLTTTSYAMAICAKVLLGDPVMMPKNVYKKYSTEACKSIRKVIEHFKQYYDVFNVNKKLSLTPYIRRRIDVFNSAAYDLTHFKKLDAERVHDSEYVEREIREFNDQRD